MPQGDNGILFRQIAVVLGVAFGSVWAATQWTADVLSYQVRPGTASFDFSGIPLYEPWKLFEWSCFHNAHAPDVCAWRSHRGIERDACGWRGA